MKKIQRIVSLLLAMVMLAGIAAGCGENKADDEVTMGKWLTLIADSFGIENYTEVTPFFKNVGPTDEYFSAFQAAAEWEILAPTDAIDANTCVTWGDALVTLVNAGEFAEDGMPDEDKYSLGIQLFDNTIRDYWRNRAIPIDKAVLLLDKAQYAWAHRTYSESEKIEKIEYGDAVIDMSDETNFEGIEYVYAEDGNVIMPAKYAEALSEDDIYVLPANETTNASINKVGSIEIQGDLALITNEELSDEEIMSYLDDMQIRETYSPDFTKIEGIYDEFGNPISFTSNTETASSASAEDFDVQATHLAYTGQENEGAQGVGILDNAKGSISLNIKGYTFVVTMSKDSVGVEFNKEIGKTENRYREETAKIFGKVTFDNVSLTRDIDFSWGQLHSATLRMDKTTTIEAGVKYEKENRVGRQLGKGQDAAQSISTILSGYKRALENVKKDVKNSKVKDADIYICRIALLEGGFASVDFVIKGNVTVSGELKLSLEMVTSSGVEYKNGKMRYIKSQDKDVNLEAGGEIEVCITPGFEITVLKKFAIIDCAVDIGVGAAVTGKAHLFDAEGHELYSGDATITAEEADELEDEAKYTTAEEIEAFANEHGKTWTNKDNVTYMQLLRGACIDLRIYPIVKIKIGSTSTLLGKLAAKLKFSVECEVVGKKTTWLRGHVDIDIDPIASVQSSLILGSGVGQIRASFGKNAECTYDPKPWDEAVEDADAIEELPEQDSSIAVSDTIMLAEVRVFMEEGDKVDIKITGMPQGYELSDLEFSVKDTSVVKADDNCVGRFIAVEEGTTTVAIKTKDGKHSAVCAVTVNPAAGTAFTPLAPNI